MPSASPIPIRLMTPARAAPRCRPIRLMPSVVPLAAARRSG